MSMEKITPPRSGSNDNRFNECQGAIEGPLQDLVRRTTDAGWDVAETLAAIIDVSENLALGLGADVELERLLGATESESDDGP